MARREFLFLNNTFRTEEGVKKLDRFIREREDRKIWRKRWRYLIRHIKPVERRIIESWVSEMRATGFVPHLDREPSNVTWTERIVGHAVQNSHLSSRDLFDKAIRDGTAVPYFMARNYFERQTGEIEAAS